MTVYGTPPTTWVVTAGASDVNDAVAVWRTRSISWLARFAATSRFLLFRTSVSPLPMVAARPVMSSARIVIAITSSSSVMPASDRC